MRPTSSYFVPLKKGDIIGLGVVHLTDHTRLVLYDEDYVAPLLHAVLTPSERATFIAALEAVEPAQVTEPLRHSFRATRPRTAASEP